MSLHRGMNRLSGPSHVADKMRPRRVSRQGLERSGRVAMGAKQPRSLRTPAFRGFRLARGGAEGRGGHRIIERRDVQAGHRPHQLGQCRRRVVPFLMWKYEHPRGPCGPRKTKVP